MTTLKKYIITTGDISDFDGFLTFPMYKKIAIEKGFDAVVFIMNYPAYFRFENRLGTFTNKNHFKQIYTTDENMEKFGRNDDNLGYNYSYLDFYYYHSIFFESIGITPENLKGSMYQLAYKMCYYIWKSIEGNMNFIFIDGGINELNPFAIHKLKNEISVYSNVLKELDDVIDEMITKQSLESFIENLTENDEIYMDMNGSFAFYNNEIQEIMKKTEFKFVRCLKALSIMGGVYNNTEVKTMSLPFLNRLTSATMNQFYAPLSTKSFLNDLKVFNQICKIFIISNNHINDLFTWKNLEDFKDILTRSRILNKDEIYIKLFNAYYATVTAYKPFDIASAYALIKFILYPNYFNERIPNKLLFNSIYGLTIIDKTTNYSKTNFLKAYCENIEYNPQILYSMTQCETKLNGLSSDILNKLYILFTYYMCAFSDKEPKDKNNHKILLENLINEYLYYDLFDVYDVDYDTDKLVILHIISYMKPS